MKDNNFLEKEIDLIIKKSIDKIIELTPETNIDKLNIELDIKFNGEIKGNINNSIFESAFNNKNNTLIKNPDSKYSKMIKFGKDGVFIKVIKD